MNNKICPVCGTEVALREYRGGTSKRFCSRKCQKRAANQRYDARYPERRRERQSKFDKSDKGKSISSRNRLKEGFSLKSKARDVLRRAVANGSIIKPNMCVNCKRIGRVEGHHHKGYEYSLDVQWLCPKCHRLLE